MSAKDSYTAALQLALEIETQVGTSPTVHLDREERALIVQALRQYGPNYRTLIEEHNHGCEASCRARYELGACVYRRPDGSFIYGTRDCHDCPRDWVIELPPNATVGSK